MSEGVYAAAAGMAAQQSQMDAIGNDIANVSTPGYHSERIGFEDLVYTAEQNGAPAGAGAATVDLGRTSAEGSLEQTGDPLSVAIDGPGYLQVRQADGSIALTRDGQLAVDASGALVTQSGQRLVPPITLPKGADPSDLKIGADGAVTAGGKSIGKITLVDVTNAGGLLSAGDNLFTPTAASGAPAPAKDSTLEQGSIETSNVDLGTAMVDMITAQRGYQLASEAIKDQDQLLQIANQLVK
ncbi:MAG TPA: flagellar hook-basal body protein [Gaiellaceae bacterium]|nr:flagellar hook-basal body protein [Gaiellaceae bacterium]